MTAVVAMLADWARGADRWAARPAAVLAIGSRRRPLLVADLAGRIATVGRLPLLGVLPPSPQTALRTPAGRANSAQRVHALHEAFAVPLPVAARLADLAGPVLLVDDAVDSGWTMAVVSRLLRQCGAPAVLPVALASA
ncbi:MAG: hypothetical protein HKP61_05680 [Dactylosporangium sp.]|nr:hypothetical protein [Dactylosporangium sp.]